MPDPGRLREDYGITLTFMVESAKHHAVRSALIRYVVDGRGDISTVLAAAEILDSMQEQWPRVQKWSEYVRHLDPRFKDPELDQLLDRPPPTPTDDI